jgi:hypothetical protein
MRSYVGRITLTGVLVGGLVVASAGAAYGADTSSPPSAIQGAGLAAIQARAAAAINLRLAVLNIAIPKVQGDKWITSADKTTLVGTMNGDVTGLTALGAKIQSDTIVTVAKTDYQTIFTGYRVFALAVPQARFAAASDDITDGVLPRLNDAQSKLAALLSGVDSSKNSPAVQAAMADLAHQIDAITNATSGRSTTVLGYTPLEYDANHAILTGPRATLLGARSDVEQARNDIATVVASLK